MIFQVIKQEGKLSKFVKIQVYIEYKKGLNQAGLIGQAFDKELVTDEIISKFF